MCNKMRGMQLGCFIMVLASALCIEAQRSPVFYYQSWLYPMNWRPLELRRPLDTQQLSLGYQGPQIFPGEDQAPVPHRHRPVLLGLLLPQQPQDPFRLPFRPSPFAGYSLDDEQQQQEQHLQQQQQHHLEPAFFAPGYPQQADYSKPIEEPSVEPSQEQEQQHHYLYMSPENLYNLVRS